MPVTRSLGGGDVMSIDQCKKCGVFLWGPKNCSCKRYEFNHEGWGEEWREINIRGDHEAAAERVAEESWNEDPVDPSNFELVVSIKDSSGIIKKFIVDAESRVKFNARELV